MIEPATDDAPRFAVRALREADHAFTYSCFLRGYRESDYTAGIPNDAFFDVHKGAWTTILATWNVLVAHPEGDEDEIAGFLAFKGKCVAWCYVKKVPWRGCGVATQLMREAGFGVGSEVQALFGSSWGMSKARSAGYRVWLVSYVEAIRLLLGVD